MRTTIGVYLDIELIMELKKIAESKNTSLSSLSETLLLEGLARLQKKAGAVNLSTDVPLAQADAPAE